MKQDQIEKHLTTQSILLHLLPGILSTCVYLLARQPVANLGYPSVVPLILAFAVILIPVELGYLLYQGKKKWSNYITGNHQPSSGNLVVAKSYLGTYYFYCDRSHIYLDKTC